MSLLTRAKRPEAELPAEDALAILTRSFESRTVRVNLLPPEIGEVRRLRTLQGGIAAGLLVVVGAVGAFWWDEHGKLSDAKDDQQIAQDAHGVLQSQVARLTPVDTMFKQVDKANLMLTSAAAGNVDWAKLLDGLSRHLPAHTWLTNANLSAVGATTTGGTTGSTATSGTTGTTGTTGTASASPYGSLQLTGGAEVMGDGADLIDGLDATPGLSGAALTNLSVNSGNTGTYVTWAATVSLGADALLPAATAGGNQ